jgi:response regulator RpfG family c-di-GMP phosphodiesterase
VLKALLDAKAITPDLYEGALHKQQAYGGEIEEILLDSGVVDEQKLLNVLATFYKTKFVHSDKLKQAKFAEGVLKAIPEKVVRNLKVFPIAWDIKTRTLSIITNRPQDMTLLQEVEKSSAARTVVPYLTRPACVIAAIGRWYDRDIHAFTKLDREDMSAYQQMMDVYERNVLDESSIAAAAVSTKGENAMFSAEDLQRAVANPASGREDGTGVEFTAGEGYLSTLHIMMGLIENDRGDLRGHSVQVSRAVRQMAERIRMSDAETIALSIAGAIHDLGKFGLFHLTSLNVGEWQGHWEAAAARYTVPGRLFEPVHLPAPTHHALDHMYERMDGSGFPEGLKGKDIPLGARILAIVDTFSDLTMNPKNPFRRVLTPDEGIKVLDKYRNKIFDPMLVEVYKSLVAGDALRDSILAGQNNILVIDPDPEQAVILELNLASKGFSVEVVGNTRLGMEHALKKKVDLVITEVDLKPIDGFEFARRIHGNEKTADLPIIFFTTRSDQKDVDRGFELGAADYLVKPSSVDVVVAKVQRTLQSLAARSAPAAAGRGGGVSGSLKEMDLPDLVQVLSQGRKSGALHIQSSAGPGEIHFAEGKIVHVAYKGQEGEQAFYDLLHLNDGSFQVDPSAKAEKITVKLSVESLLLEGMRLLDESNR